MPRTRFYYTLVYIDPEQCRWVIEYGSYDRSEVAQERSDFHDSHIGRYILKRNSRIITSGDKQTDIQAKVDQLNADLIDETPSLHYRKGTHLDPRTK